MSTVIKGSGPLSAEARGSFNLDDIGGRAKEYLEQVRSAAAEIIAQAQREAAAIRQQAQEQGRGGRRGGRPDRRRKNRRPGAIAHSGPA